MKAYTDNGFDIDIFTPFNRNQESLCTIASPKINEKKPYIYHRTIECEDKNGKKYTEEYEMPVFNFNTDIYS